MPRTVSLPALAVLLLTFFPGGRAAGAADPSPADVPLPSPTPLPGRPPVIIHGPVSPPLVVHPGDLPPVIHVPGPYPGTETVIYTRPSALDVWRNYGTDRQGFQRPLVIMTPAGSFYRATGRPYNLESVKPSVIMPYATD